jgi:hypothetical protein
MKKILNIIYTVALIVLLSYQLFATDWYVDNTATGLNNGTSWTNAWESFADINWASIGVGDDIYISGGTDSLTYTGTLYPDCKGTATNWCNILPGSYSSLPSGHSGKVIFDGANQTTDGIILSNGGSGKPSYLKIKGFTIQNVLYGVYANFDEAHDCLAFDSLTITNHALRAIEMVTLLAYNVDSIFVENCRFVSDNYYAGESDGIYFSGTHHNFIDNNYIRVPNQQPTAHVDVLQGYLTDGWVITNNICINDSVNSLEGGGIPIILGSQGALPVIIYNNFTYMGGVWYASGNWAGTLMTRWYDTPPMPPTWIIHNTVVSNGPRVRGIWLEYATATTTTLINNIIAQYSSTTSGVLDNFDNSTGSNLRVDSIRNNLFYRSWDSDVGFAGNLVGSGGSPTGTPTGWTEWSTTYGGTGVKGDPLFISNIGYEPNQGLLDVDLQSNSPAINQGEDAEWYINYLNVTYGLNGRLQWTDIDGNPRDATPDIGAFEYATTGWTPPDTIPSFSFTAVNNAELNTEYIATGTFSGADSTFNVWTTTGAEFRINAGSYSTAMKTAVNGNTVSIKNLTGGTYELPYTETIVAGGYSRNFVVTTKTEPVIPPSVGTIVKGSDGKILRDSTGKIIKVLP